jgi:hypothetical protein
LQAFSKEFAKVTKLLLLLTDANASQSNSMRSHDMV